MQAGLSMPHPVSRPSLWERLSRRSGDALVSGLGWLVPSLAQVIFLGCLGAALRAGGMMVSGDGDPSRHLVVGEYILSTRSIPRQDLFSHTLAGQPFVPYEWLAEVASAAGYRLVGLAGPVLLHGSIIGLTFALLMRHLQRRGHPLLLALAVTVLAAMASFVHWLARPHVFTFLGTVVFSSLLDDWFAGRRHSRWLWVLPATMLVWANAHGGFLIGFILLGAYAGADALRCLAGGRAAAASARRRLTVLLPVAAATLAATLATPAGPALLGHVTGYLRNKYLVDHTAEYASPNFHEGDVRFFLLMLLGTVAALAWSRRRPALHEGLLVLSFSYFALYSARNIPLFAIVVAPILAAQLGALPAPADGSRAADRLLGAVGAWLARRNVVYSRVDGRSRGQLWPLAALTALLLLAAAHWRQGQPPLGVDFLPARQPVAAAAYLKAHPPAGNGFNQFIWGGYLLYALWPEQRVFIDGQTDFYGEALTREYARVAGLDDGWQDVLDRHNIQWVIFGTDTALVRQLRSMPEWRVLYQDDVATVLARN